MTAGRTWGGIASVWLLALIGTVLVAVFASGDFRFSWLWLVLAACMLVAFAIQLSTHRKVGFIDRVAASIVGAFLIIGGTGVAFSLTTLYGG